LTALERVDSQILTSGSGSGSSSDPPSRPTRPAYLRSTLLLFHPVSFASSGSQFSLPGSRVLTQV
jgi:hypothetical protein